MGLERIVNKKDAFKGILDSVREGYRKFLENSATSHPDFYSGILEPQFSERNGKLVYESTVYSGVPKIKNKNDPFEFIVKVPQELYDRVKEDVKKFDSAYQKLRRFTFGLIGLHASVKVIMGKPRPHRPLPTSGYSGG